MYGFHISNYPSNYLNKLLNGDQSYSPFKTHLDRSRVTNGVKLIRDSPTALLLLCHY